MDGLSATYIVLSLVITAVAYVGLPAIYAFAIKKRRLPKKNARIVCIITGVVIYLAFCFYRAYIGLEGGGSLYPAVIWSVVAYYIVKEKSSSTEPVDKPEPSQAPMPAKPTYSEHSIEPTDNINTEASKTVIPVDSLKKLKSLHDAGVLTDEEFADKKKKLLNL